MNRDGLKAAAQIPNVRAFLRAIRLGEGTSDPRGYHRIVGGEEFEDLSAHPNKKIWIPRYEIFSSAAGAYQILRKTWNGLVAQYGFENFSEDCQDQAAVALIAGRGALGNVIRGEVEEAIRKCRNEWASLPGSEHGQRTESVENVLAEYQKWGGEIAT